MGQMYISSSFLMNKTWRTSQVKKNFISENQSKIIFKCISLSQKIENELSMVFFIHRFFPHNLQVAVKNSSNKKTLSLVKINKQLTLFFIIYFHKTYVRVSKRHFSSFHST